MALKSSNDRLNQAKSALDPEAIVKESKVAAKLLKEQNSALKRIQLILHKQSTEDDSQEEDEKISNLKSSNNSLKTISSHLSSFNDSVSSLNGTISSVSATLNDTVSILASIKTSLVQMTGVLSAFRADYIMANNGQTPRGEGFYNQSLLTSDLNILSSIQNDVLKSSLSSIRKAANFANMMSNSVRGKIGNAHMAKDDDEEGLLTKLFGKIGGDSGKEIAGMLTPLLQMAGIDDSNLASLAGSGISRFGGKGANKQFEALNKTINELAQGGGNSGVLSQIAALLQDKTGLGSDVQDEVKRERDPNLVMSSLAPFADDIKDMVKSSYQGVLKRPTKIPIYAKPVWVVNSSDQTNYVEASGNVETKESETYKKRIKEILSGMNTNQNGENGKALVNYNDPNVRGSNPYGGYEMSGELLDKYFESIGINPDDLESKFAEMEKLQQEVNDLQDENDRIKYIDQDEEGNLVEYNKENKTKKVARELSNNRTFNEAANVVSSTIDGAMGAGAMGAAVSGGMSLIMSLVTGRIPKMDEMSDDARAFVRTFASLKDDDSDNPPKSHSGRRALRRYHSGKNIAPGVSEVTEENPITNVKDTDTIIPASKKDQNNPAEIINDITALVASSSLYDASSTENIMKVAQITVNGGDTDGTDVEKKAGLFTKVKGFMTSIPSLKKSKSGKKALTDASKIEKDTKVKEDKKGKKQRVFGQDDENFRKEDDEEEGEKSEAKGLKAKATRFLDKKLKKGKETVINKLKETKLGKKVMKVKKGVEDTKQRIKDGINKKIDSAKETVKNKITDPLKNTAKDLGNKALDNLKGVGGGIKAAASAKIGGAFKAGTKAFKRSLSQGGGLKNSLARAFKSGAKAGKHASAKDAFKKGFKKSKNNSQQKREEKLNKANQEAVDAEKKAIDEANQKKIDAAKENADKTKDANDKAKDEEQKTQEEINEEKKKAAKDESDKESDATDKAIKREEQADKKISDMEEKSEKKVEDLKEAQANKEVVTQEVANDAEVGIEGTATGIESTAEVSSKSTVGIPMTIAAVAAGIGVIGKLVSKAIKNTSKGKKTDTSSASASVSKSGSKAAKDADKEQKKKDKKKEKEDKKKEKEEKKEKIKDKLKEAKNKNQKVYVDTDLKVKDAESGSTVKYVKDGEDTDDDLDLKKKKHRIQFISRAAKLKEFKIVKKPKKKAKTSEGIKSSKDEKAADEEMQKAAKGEDDNSVKGSNSSADTKEGKGSFLGGKFKITKGKKKKSKSDKLQQMMLMATMPFLFMNSKMQKNLTKSMSSPFGSMLMQNPEKASGILFNMGNGGTALSLSESGTSNELSKLSENSSTISTLFNSLISKLKGENDSSSESATSTNLADGSYSDNATLAYAQYKARLKANETTNEITSSLLGDISVETDDNGNTMTTSQIVDAVKAKNAKKIAVIDGTGSSGSSSGAGISGSGGEAVMAAVALVTQAYEAAGIDGDGSDYDQSGKTVTISVNGMSITTRPDCTGFVDAVVEALGYDSELRNSAAWNSATSVNDQNGNPSSDWTKLSYSSTDDIEPGDICIIYDGSSHHGEIAAGVSDGNVYGWSYGSDSGMAKANAAGAAMLNGTAPLQACIDAGSKINGHKTYTCLWRFSGTIVSSDSSSASGSNSSVSANGQTVADWVLSDLGNGAYISSSMSESRSGKEHGGTDFAGVSEGTPVHTPVGGSVIKSAKSAGVSSSMGNFVIIKGNDGNYWRLMHMKDTPMVDAGDTVTFGQQVGLLGNTGQSTGPHLHVDISPNDTTNGKNSNMLDSEQLTLTGKGKKGEDDDLYFHKDLHGYSGLGNSNHVYQRDFSEYGYNKSGDSELQTLGDSGCGPAAASVVKSIYENNKKGKGKRGRKGKGKNDKKVKIGKYIKNKHGKGKYGRGTEITLEGDSVQEQFWRFMIANGVSMEYTAGIMGNIEQESGFNPYIMEGGATSTEIPYSSGGYGLIQWTGSRYQTAADNEAYSLSGGLYHLNSTEGQFIVILALAIASQELISLGDGYGSYAAQCVKNAGGLDYANGLSVEDACYFWEENVERAGIKAMDNRVSAAQQYYEAFSNGDFSGGTVVDLNGSSSGSSGSSSANITGYISVNVDSYVSGEEIANYADVTGSIWYDGDEESEDSSDESTATAADNGSSLVSDAVASELSKVNDSSSSSSTSSSSSSSTSSATTNSTSSSSNSSTTNNITSSTSTITTTDTNEEGVVPSSSYYYDVATTNSYGDTSTSVTIENTDGNTNTTTITSGNSTIIVNNSNGIELDDILDNFHKLNETQSKALEVLKEIAELIGDDEAPPQLMLSSDGLDLLLKGI